MGDFFKNILGLGEGGNILDSIKEKLGGGFLGSILEKIDLENLDLGNLAQSVLSIIGLAGNSLSVEEETETEELEEE